MFFPDRYPTGRWDVKGWLVTPTEHPFETPDAPDAGHCEIPQLEASRRYDTVIRFVKQGPA